MINHLRLLSDYESLYSYAVHFRSRGQVDNLLRCVQALSHSLYHTKLKFNAPELDQLIKDVVDDFRPVSALKGGTEKIIFIDYFGWDNKGLSQQYLSFLIEGEYDFVYVHLNSSKSFLESNIYKTLQASNSCSLLLDEVLSIREKIKKLSHFFELISPRCVIFHTAPWDVISVALCFIFPRLIKININITDHAFWLGATAFDYVINFRPYGGEIALKKRAISIEKLLYAPMYPIVSSDTRLIPEIQKAKADGKVVLISGGALYKVADDECRFLNLIASILEFDKNVVFFILGSGDRSSIDRFVSDRELGGQFFVLPESPHIFSFLRSADIYIGTFPVAGGLMTQLCSMAGLPFVAMKEKGDSDSKLLSVLAKFPKYKVLFDDMDACKREIFRLIYDKGYRRERSDDFSSCAPSKFAFVNSMTKILSDIEDMTCRELNATHAVQFLENDSVVLSGRENIDKYYLIPFKYMGFSALRYDLLLFFKAIPAIFRRVFL